MNNVQRTLMIGLVLVGALLWTSSPALADGITYTETDVATGTLGGASFSNALVTITLVGDTSTLTSGLFGALEVFGPATVTVQGIGTASFTDSICAFINNSSSVAGISDSSLGTLDVLDTFDSAFATYGLTTGIGPVTDLSLYNPDYSFGTTNGNFVLASDSGTSTFTATTAVPEPASFLLLGVGLSGLFGARRKKTRSATT